MKNVFVLFSLAILAWPSFGQDKIKAKADRVIESVKLDKTYAEKPDAYKESRRPQFHFSPQTGWMNDPNGLVYYKGEYHLFFQAWPESVAARGKIWSHAVSTDLIYWKQIDHALLSEGRRQMFSGSAVIDHNNTAGFQTGKEKTMVAIYTKTKPHVQCIAWSEDRGRTFTKFKDPVVDNLLEKNRDPKVFWYEPDKKWVMLLYLGKRSKFALLGSKDLKKWEKLSDLDIPGGHECPEMFQLPVDNDKNNLRWVVMDGQELYMVGQFDGKTFTPDNPEALPSEWGHNCKAGQVFTDAPDGRIAFIGWMKAKVGSKVGGVAKDIYAGMPFSQQMSIPRDLSLKTTPEGIRMFSWPVREIEKLRGQVTSQSDVVLKSGMNALSGVKGDLLDIEAEIEPGDAKKITLDIHGTSMHYDSTTGQFSWMGQNVKLPANKYFKLRVLVDRTSIEIFINDGRYVMSNCYIPVPGKNYSLSAEEGNAKITFLKSWPLKSIWK